VRYVLTIATGKKLYLDMAVNLARSFFWWHADSDIKFIMVTDQEKHIPADIKPRIQIINIKAGSFGEGFSPKLYLNEVAYEGQTLFIDSDCLIYGDLNRVFDIFKGHKVAVIGGYIEDGEWFGDIKSICAKFKVPHLPKFNGGVYYLEKSPIADEVYLKARELESNYDDIGFVRLRNRPNDEVLMAVAMQLNNQAPIPDHGDILAEFVNFTSGIKSDLLNGMAELYNNPGNKNYNKTWHLTLSKPVIVHYLGYHNQIMPYTKEVKQLKYLFEHNYSVNISRCLAFLQVTLPYKILSNLTNMLRPLYHLLFGVRAVKKSERVID